MTRSLEASVVPEECSAFYFRLPHSDVGRRYGPEASRCYASANSPIHRPVESCERKPCPWPSEHHDFGVGDPVALREWLGE